MPVTYIRKTLWLRTTQRRDDAGEMCSQRQCTMKNTRFTPVQWWARMRQDEEKNNEGKLEVYVTSVDLPPPSQPSELH